MTEHSQPVAVPTEDVCMVCEGLCCEESDAAVFSRAVVAGVARWEFFACSEEEGEVCVGGMRYTARLRVGVPILGLALRAALEQHTCWKNGRIPRTGENSSETMDCGCVGGHEPDCRSHPLIGDRS